nr:TATA element modulatory factor [Leptinotarsa decemlineata]XP_023013212.1 TATA element modulatory factor [Leptinotarsa decemlineata]XP_023013213.1 TATA element modulatory factor [Leptinotarsa decemlineata]XP_023013214.1 TATA element modulatory factor [Leptinotarsa decemlineata]
MSWFDATGLASIAKSALKEAQRTIDKALDIKDDNAQIAPSTTPIDINSEDFFGTWGVAESENNDLKSKVFSKENRMSSSIWGSFTGSFFENQKDIVKSASNTSLDDTIDCSDEHFSRSKLVVQRSEDGDDESEKVAGKNSSDDLSDLVEISLSDGKNEAGDNQNDTLIVRRSDKLTTSQINRLSGISGESGKNSSESVDILTCSTECTSPDSDLLSLGQSISTSSSALGSQPGSDSVEIIGDSLTSPSSVEVIGSSSTSSRRQSQLTDEFVSPLLSPWSEEKSSVSEKTSPDSVEVIPEDQEENSIAEDTVSYTSLSESTSATVLDSTFNSQLKSHKMLKDTFMRADSLNENENSTNTSFISDAITRAPSRTMHLPLTQVSQVMIDTQPQSNKQDMPNILPKTNVIDIPSESEMVTECRLDFSTDESSHSDKTVIGSDSIMESSSDTSTATEASSHSTYLKIMLADAMLEKSFSDQEQNNKVEQFCISSQDSDKNSLENISISQVEILPRENSPVSSGSRSDLVKIGSDHTSGDELETTTSSDIEIISSPNGDSSSTQSRQSPAKPACVKTKSENSTIDSLLCKMTIKKTKGHTRELSEASSISDDFHSETDRLLKKISEMTEILESREAKLIDLNHRNAELQEMNSDLQIQMDSIITRQLESADVSQVTEEYTQRLSALEKKFQQTLREKDSLRKDLEQIKQEAASRMSNGEINAVISEKDEVIRELREEGEKLSKQQLQHSNIIKKLRTKEKENENTIKHLRERIELLSSESDRLKKSLAAKEEVERTQIEAVHQLTTRNKKLDGELLQLKGQIEDLTQKHDTTKRSLEAAKKDIAEKNKSNSELLIREQMVETLENQKKLAEAQNEEIMNQLEDLRHKLRQSEEVSIKKEEWHREEKNKLLRRLEEAEARNEELSQSVLEVSKPLIRQLESLQATHTMKISGFEKMEEELTMKLNELQAKLQTSISSEKEVKEECIRLRSRLSEIDSRENSSKHKIERLEMELERQKTENLLTKQELNNKIDHLNDIIRKNKEVIDEQERQLLTLQHQLTLEKSTNEMDKRQAESLQIQNRINGDIQSSGVEQTSLTGSNSPTLSLGKLSVSESMAGSFWSQDEPFDTGATPRYTNMFEMQMLQSNLKQREGELQQLQWELNRREQERSLLNTEISTLLTRVEELAGRAEDYDSLKTRLQELERQYDTLCQLFGEKVEENEELKLDLQDVKEMYKGQIDELLRQQKQNTK